MSDIGMADMVAARAKVSEIAEIELFMVAFVLIRKSLEDEEEKSK
jgi:hypothetical protein